MDHRAFYFARAEKRKVTSNKWLLDEIKDLRADHARAADHAAEKAQAAEEAANKAAEVAASASATAAATASATVAAATTTTSAGAPAASGSSVPGGLAAPTTRAAQSEGYGAAAAAAAAAAAGRAAKAAAKKADERTKRGLGPNRALVAGDTVTTRMHKYDTNAAPFFLLSVPTPKWRMKELFCSCSVCSVMVVS